MFGEKICLLAMSTYQWVIDFLCSFRTVITKIAIKFPMSPKMQITIRSISEVISVNIFKVFIDDLLYKLALSFTHNTIADQAQNG